MSSFFLHMRMADPETMAFGLYSWWSRYVPYVSMMIGALSRIYVTKVINGADDMSPYQGEIIELLRHFLEVQECGRDQTFCRSCLLENHVRMKWPKLLQTQCCHNFLDQ